MLRIDVSFLLIGVLCLLTSLMLGIGMSSAHNFQLALLQANLNLFGFVSLSVFGLAYRLYPALQRSRLAMPHLAVSSIGALVFPFGIDVSVSHAFPAAAFTTLLIVLGGAVLFAANLILNVALSAAPGRMAPAVPWAA